MGIIDSLFPKKNSFAALTLDDLRRERIRLDIQREQLVRQVDERERRKNQFFLQIGNEPSQTKKVNLAQDVDRLDRENRAAQSDLSRLSKQMGVVTAFSQIKERQRKDASSKIWKAIKSIDLGRLEQLVEAATVQDNFDIDTFERILTTVDDGEAAFRTTKQDDRITQILLAAEALRAETTEKPELAEQIATKRLEAALRSDKDQSD